MNQKKISQIAGELSNMYDTKFYRPNNICCDVKTRGFYKQNYCGCVYSLLERMKEKYEIQ